MDEKKRVRNANVEFGTEFGDFNAAKHMEIPFMNKDKQKEKKNPTTKDQKKR